jgi:gamma-glutamyl hydrolase
MKIGIIALPKHPIIENYIRWIKDAGATPIIIPYSITKTDLIKQMDKLQGVIWTGGAIETERYSENQRITYLTTLQRCFLIAKDCNDHGRYFPIWGSCLGFETLVLMGEDVPLSKFFTRVQIHERTGRDTITFLSSPSRIKQFFPLKLRNAMARIPCATHHHKLGFDITPLPHMRFVSVDSGFINIIEYVDYPFYGVQFHPERPFSPFSEEISRQFGQFLIKECQKN